MPLLADLQDAGSGPPAKRLENIRIMGWRRFAITCARCWTRRSRRSRRSCCGVGSRRTRFLSCGILLNLVSAALILRWPAAAGRDRLPAGGQPRPARRRAGPARQDELALRRLPGFHRRSDLGRRGVRRDRLLLRPPRPAGRRRADRAGAAGLAAGELHPGARRRPGPGVQGRHRHPRRAGRADRASA